MWRWVANGVFVVASIPAGNWQKRTVLHTSAIFLMFVVNIRRTKQIPNKLPTMCFQWTVVPLYDLYDITKVWVGHFMSYPKRRKFMIKYMQVNKNISNACTHSTWTHVQSYLCSGVPRKLHNGSNTMHLTRRTGSLDCGAVGVRDSHVVEGDVFNLFCSLRFSSVFRPMHDWSDPDGKPIGDIREQTSPSGDNALSDSHSNIRLIANRTMHSRRYVCTIRMIHSSEFLLKGVSCIWIYMSACQHILFTTTRRISVNQTYVVCMIITIKATSNLLAVDNGNFV